MFLALLLVYVWWTIASHPSWQYQVRQNVDYNHIVNVVMDPGMNRNLARKLISISSFTSQICFERCSISKCHKLWHSHAGLKIWRAVETCLVHCIYALFLYTNLKFNCAEAKRKKRPFLLCLILFWQPNLAKYKNLHHWRIICTTSVVYFQFFWGSACQDREKMVIFQCRNFTRMK